ncbi:MAG TPA: response regulator [Cyclobacteriaceae bacterium]|nr:response regulator [Cyclobacteriaceae bacterium]
MKILMADNDTDDRLLASIAFKKLNMAHSLDFVTDGQELMDYLYARLKNKRPLPDLVILDLNMPKKDGRVALKEIKSNEQLKHLDVIIFSTSTYERDMTYTLGLGAKSYIVKPTDYNELIEVFRAMCDGLVTKPGWQYSIQHRAEAR